LTKLGGIIGGAAIRPPAMPGMGVGTGMGVGSGAGPIPPLLSLPGAALDVTATLTSDRAGRFRLEGIARERLVYLDVQGQGMVLKTAHVVTRPGFKVTDRFLGPVFDLPLAPGKEIVGVVKEKGTGRPVAGAQVSVGGERVSATNPTRTDERGAFRIAGVLKRPLYRVHVSAPDHFHSMQTLKDTPGRDPVRADFEMERGLYVEGRLLDGATGKPVAGAVTYDVRADNSALKTFGLAPLAGRGTVQVGADGKFRVLTVPGPGYLAVLAEQDRFARMVPEGWDGNRLPTLSRQLSPHYYHATVAISPDEKKPASLRCDIRLDPGQSRSGKIIDPNGQPVTGVIAFGLKAVPAFSRLMQLRGPVSKPDFSLKDSAFTAIGLDPKQPRHLVFIHPQKKLGKVFLVRGDEKEPLVVKLEPLGAVSGRVLNEENKPAAGQTVTARPPGPVAEYRDYPLDLWHNDGRRDGRGEPRMIAWLPEAAQTDDKGRFRLDGLVPGLKYSLMVQGERRGPRPGPSYMVRPTTVEPGQTKDLGDLPRPKRP
jgi:hypothetical protein